MRITETLVVDSWLDEGMTQDFYGVLCFGIQYMVGTVLLFGVACKDVAVRCL